MAIFAGYHWPGNVRQLQNIVRNIVVLHNGEQVLVEHLPHPINSSLDNKEVTEIKPLPYQTVQQKQHEPNEVAMDISINYYRLKPVVCKNACKAE